MEAYPVQEAMVEEAMLEEAMDLPAPPRGTGGGPSAAFDRPWQ